MPAFAPCGHQRADCLPHIDSPDKIPSRGLRVALPRSTPNGEHSRRFSQGEANWFCRKLATEIERAPLLSGIVFAAEAVFREAIRIQPEYADAHNNLGNLLSGSGDFQQARYHFEIALWLRPEDAATRYNFAMALGRARHFDEAQQQLEASLRIDPELADAHQLLADLLLAKGQAQSALRHYRKAVRMQPESGRAQLGLGSALAATGDLADAVPHLQKAAAGSDPAAREGAAQILRQLGKGR